MTYNFRLRAMNKWGFGGYSSIVPIQASKEPGQPLAPTIITSGNTV